MAKAKKTKIDTFFSIGENVVYPIQGVGEIKSIEKKLFNEKLVLYYEIYFETPDMTVMVPVDNAENLGMRKVVSDREARKALEFISQDYEPVAADWKARYQLNLDLLKKGTIKDIAMVVKALYDRSILKELPILERKLYDSARQLLIDEVALALKKSKTDSANLILDKLEKDKKSPAENG